MVLRVATATPLGLSLPSSRDERLPTRSSGGVVGATPLIDAKLLLENRDGLVGHDPLVVDGLERPVRLDLRDCLVHARRQRAVLLKNCANRVRLQLTAELPDDR